MPAFIDLTGRRFAELLVEGLADYKIKNRPAWVCLCDCGERKTVGGDTLKAGDVKCCGRHKTKFYTEALSARSKVQNRKYPADSDSQSRVYTLWRAMKWRCTDPTHEAYARYGGADITICAEWMEYECFRSWAVSSGYADTLTLDRIDNDKGYEPGNCRWATPKEQARNRRGGLVTLTAHGTTKPLVDWMNDPRCRVSYGTLLKRIAAGCPPEFALGATEREARAMRGKHHLPPARKSRPDPKAEAS